MQNQVATKVLQHLTKQSSDVLSKVTPETVYRAMLMSEDTFTTPLFLIVMDKYGPEALQWAPETIRRELEDDFQLQLPRYTLDKLMAAVTIVTTNYFYKDVTRFIELCNILSGDEFQPDEFEPADAGEILLAMTESLLLWPPDDDVEDTEFSEEIQEYIRQVLDEEGILKPFDVLRLAFRNDRAAVVDAEYADDPEMFAAIYDMQQNKQDGLKVMLMENVEALIQQLRLLPLSTGNTEQAVKQLQTLVSQAGAG